MIYFFTFYKFIPNFNFNNNNLFRNYKLYLSPSRSIHDIKSVYVVSTGINRT